MKSHIKKSKCNIFLENQNFDGDVMHLLFALFAFSLILKLL